MPDRFDLSPSIESSIKSVAMGVMQNDTNRVERSLRDAFQKLGQSVAQYVQEAGAARPFLAQLVDHVRACLRDANELPSSATPAQNQAAFDELAAAGYTLHRALERAGIPVQHSHTMLKNRGVPPDTLEFYRHVHPVEDLLAIAANAV